MIRQSNRPKGHIGQLRRASGSVVLNSPDSKESMNDSVREFGEIRDGQHRLEAIRQLSLWNESEFKLRRQKSVTVKLSLTADDGNGSSQ